MPDDGSGAAGEVGGTLAADWWGRVLQQVADGEIRLVLSTAAGDEAVLVSKRWLTLVERRFSVVEPTPPRLSDREAQVLVLVGRGIAATEVAARLGLAVNTVHQHLTMVRRKLGVRSTGEAVLAARKAGLIPDTAGPYPPAPLSDVDDRGTAGRREAPE